MAFVRTPIDRRLANNGVVMNLTSAGNSTHIVRFQFPPTIGSDNKAVEYNETSYKFIEPVTLFKGAKAREISLKWQYVVTGGEWGINAIESQVKLTRGYFYTTIQTQIQDKAAIIIKFRAYNEVGPGGGTFSFRGEGIDVKFKGPIIEEGGKTWPLVTDLSMKLKLWTKAEASEDTPAVELPGLQAAKRLLGNPGWY